MSEIVNVPCKLRLTEIRRKNGELDPALHVQGMSRLSNSLIDQTWQQNGSWVEPVVKIHVDNNFVYVAFLARSMEETPDVGIQWRHRFDDMAFRRNVETAVRMAFDDYASARHDRGLLVTKDGLNIVTVDALAGPMPGRI
jgi:hypothetical protein